MNEDISNEEDMIIEMIIEMIGEIICTEEKSNTSTREGDASTQGPDHGHGQDRGMSDLWKTGDIAVIVSQIMASVAVDGKIQIKDGGVDPDQAHQEEESQTRKGIDHTDDEVGRPESKMKGGEKEWDKSWHSSFFYTKDTHLNMILLMTICIIYHNFTCKRNLTALSIIDHKTKQC